MKKTVAFWLFSLAMALTAEGQKSAGFLVPFPDSVRIVLENTRNMDAGTVGAAFANVWGSLGLDHQRVIQRQARVLQKKKYKLRPHLVNFYGAIADAINLEQADPTKLTNFLAVVDKVIQNEDANRANQFFASSRDFFEHHALHFDRSYRLLAKDDDYQFEYIGGELPVVQDTGRTATDQFKQWDNNQPDKNTTWQDPPQDTVTQQPDAVPSWMTPAPPPALTGAVITFSRVTLNFSSPYDSTFLKNTKGSFSLRDRIFVGNGGTFDWSSTGLGADSVYAEMGDFFFTATRPAFKCEMAKLTYVGKTQGKVPGVFEFVSQRHKNPASAVYPRFMSFKCNVPVQGMGGDQMKYQGGFSLNGRRIFSSCVNGDYSTIEVMGAADKKFRAQSKLFEFQDSIVAAHQTRIILYQGNDSIYHPAMGMRYDFGKQRLSLQKERNWLKDAPFSSSYFGVDFSADQIRWDLKTDSMNLYTAGGRSQQPLIIESVDYYHPDDYQLLNGHGFNFHPLGVATAYAVQTGTREFYSDDIAQRFGLKPSDVRMAMEFLSSKGMIRYNPTTSLVQVTEKAMHFQDASRGKIDYDNLKIHSVIDGPPNATMNLNRGDITVRGVDEFNVSDSLNVVIKPDSSLVKLLQNRDIKFNGKITAGNFEINGKDFTLKYDSFFINLNHIDSIRFYVNEKNARGQQIRRRVNNAMVGADSVAAAAGGLSSGTTKTSGTLFINLPNNKSGLKKVPNYPRLDATAGGVIYFDRREVLDGAYNRSVFFVVPPFKLDSLNDADPASINFEGTFVSSGMFPSFKEKLHTMADKSLGFTHSIPQKGYPLYQGEGRLYGGMSLDNAGIRATGKIDYLAASVESPDFIFYPDSVVGTGKVGSISEKQLGSVWFPQAVFPEYRLTWQPKQDKFVVKNLRDPFTFYNETARLDGKLNVSKRGVSGEGKLITRGSELVSEQLSFSARDFSARHAVFQVKTSNPDKPALAGDDISLRFNLEKNYADISPETEGVAAITFPYAQFKTSITDARWDLNTQKITMKKDKDVPIENSYFYTTRKELDSLVFNAEQAEYDIQSQHLKVSGIPYIVVADAKITPAGNEVLILENSQIGQLKNTTIILDTLNGYHRLTDGVVDIISRKEFRGYATYQYINAISDTFAIKMTDFHLESLAEPVKGRRRLSVEETTGATQQTVANGAVDEKENLVLAPRIYYKGDMVMYATKPALQLRGYVKLDLKKLKNYHTWLKYDQSGDEKEVFLDFDNTITEDGIKAQAGLHYFTDNSLYITFVSDKKNSEDEDFFLPSGSLYFDQQSGEFKIEDRKKAAGEKLSGKVFAYNEEKQEVRFEGPVNFFKGSPDFNLRASAIGSGDMDTNDIKMNAFVLGEMNIPSQAYQLMALNLQEVIKNEGVPEGLGDQTELLYKVANLVEERIVRDYEQKSQQNYVSLSTIAELAKPLAFANVSLKWSQKNKAFYSEGLLGMSHIGRNDINGSFEGFMEIRKNEDGSPVFHVFFKASPEAWYYFGYEDNRLMVHSSSQDFNDIIAKKSNAAKAKVGQLVFIPGSDEETLAFINRFRQRYYDMDVPYDLSGATSSRKKDKKKDDKEDDGF